jgi:hypothetical protein
MSPLPAQFTDRWRSSREGLPYEDSGCWHPLLGSNAGVRAVVADAQRRVARFGGMHMTPASRSSTAAKGLRSAYRPRAP